MGILTSSLDWTGREINGVILGIPAVPSAGSFLWDHPELPDGTIDENGDVWQEVEDAQA